MTENDPSQALLAALSPPLDAQALQRLNELDPGGRHGLLPKVLRTFDSSSRRLLEQLVAARAAGDLDGQRMVAHTLKSSSMSVGALRLSQLCADAEQRLREQRTEGLPALLDDLESECRQLLNTLQPLLPDA
ncbi:Hpt domain-containing protein [Azohydromonas caseinilytica]|uniref:Hpt domain-containing protein n=1 Tax=Azohydromonas caseinilytica TaxID=2728836 RepID=A0A848F5P4_9BURK|nr:Hpt domain-containing protein [Azohydromonas caseinilytica]NML14914.1 Hpt domain-containing protein [Azohydromonas caseinilytica]